MSEAFSTLYVRGLRIEGELPEDSYVSDLPVVQHLMQQGELAFHSPVTILVGENGVGKSTLVEAMAVAMGFNPEGGTINFHFSTEDTHSPLYQYMKVIKGARHRRDGFFLRAESMYNVASSIDEMNQEEDKEGKHVTLIDSYGGVSLHEQSHGESFLALVENRFGGHGLYILDEPEAALSPMRLMRLMFCIDKLVKRDSQFIIATHSPILMAQPSAEVIEITEKGMRPVPFRETQHYQVTRRFLENPEKMLSYLFDDKG